tara:strand:+ start:1303 stop:1905 length:603 start_codon:yes stop_codon:yes gene_type:complete
MISPIKFASHFRHNSLYAQYDLNPQVWKASMFNYLLNRYASFDIEKDYSNVAEEVLNGRYPHDFESCDYWLDQPFRKSMRYARHESCQFMSFANYFYLINAFPKKAWFHVSDFDMNNGESHFYCMDAKGQVFDPQGLALCFDIEEYKKTFTPDKITDHDDCIDSMSCFIGEYGMEVPDERFYELNGQFDIVPQPMRPVAV